MPIDPQGDDEHVPRIEGGEVSAEATSLPNTLVSQDKLVEILWPEEEQRPRPATIGAWARKGLIPSVQVRHRGRRWFNPARVREALERL